MYQIQGQLAITETQYVDFVVWTKKGVSCERIAYNDQMWREMLPLLREFYMSAFVPELYSQRVMRGLKLY